MKKIQLIAEVAQAHDGSLGILHSYIDAVAATGVDVIKFQTHIAEAESSEFEPFRVKFSYADKTRFDYWKRMQFTPAEWKEIKQHCEERGLEFLSSPFSLMAVDLLEDLGVRRYKIGSGEVGNLLMLEKIGRTKKPVIVSSGMSDWAELSAAVELLKKHGCEVSVMQCTTAYPAPPEKWGLQVIREMKERFKLPTGYSDHSGTPAACLAAAALGAELLEFHVVFSREMFGPDAKASLEMKEVKELAAQVRMIEKAMSAPIDKENITQYNELKVMFGKTLAVNKTLKAGHVLQLGDLESKKPAGKGIPAAKFAGVIGRKLKHDKNKWEFISETDID
jgi:N,N'-diacetyllegionaminate synthase